MGAASGGPELDAIGDGHSLSAETRAALTRAADPAELTTRTVTAYFAGLLAAAQGRILVVSDRPGGFRMRARVTAVMPMPRARRQRRDRRSSAMASLASRRT